MSSVVSFWPVVTSGISGSFGCELSGGVKLRCLTLDESEVELGGADSALPVSISSGDKAGGAGLALFSLFFMNAFAFEIDSITKVTVMYEINAKTKLINEPAA